MLKDYGGKGAQHNQSVKSKSSSLENSQRYFLKKKCVIVAAHSQNEGGLLNAG